MRNIPCSSIKGGSISSPTLSLTMAANLVDMLHTTRRELLPTLIGGSEETTTGVHRLYALERQGKLEFPMIAANDAYCKYLFDNRYGTGQSTWDGIMRTTNLVIAGKTVVSPVTAGAARAVQCVRADSALTSSLRR